MKTSFLISSVFSALLTSLPAYSDALFSPQANKVYIPFVAYNNQNYHAELSYQAPNNLILDKIRPRNDSPTYGEVVSINSDLSFHLKNIHYNGKAYQASLSYQGNGHFKIENLNHRLISDENRGHLNKLTSITTLEVKEIQSLIALFNLFSDTPLDTDVFNDIEFFKIEYQTPNPAGELINASALVTAPKNSTASHPLIAYQHPTITADNDAPTKQQQQDFVSLILASSGYVTVAPDYLGFGESSNLLHPYAHAKSLATTVVDALRATRTLATNQNIHLNGQIFLIGYSEGGYATLATQREIEQYHKEEFNLIASAPMAGPYDISSTMVQRFLEPTPHPNPYYFPFNVSGYNQIYGLSEHLSDYFIPPYDSQIPPLFDGSLDSPEINTQLPDNNQQLFTQQLYSSLESEHTDYFKATLRENDIYRWIPQTKTFLYHCVNDNQVPFNNSQVAYNYFQGHGATQVELKAIENVGFDNGDVHVNCAIPLLIKGKNSFDNLVHH